MTRMHHLVVGAVMVVTAVGALTACGESTMQTQGVATFSASGKIGATMGGRTPPSKQEIVKSRACLARERVRPARRTQYRPQVPHGVNEVTRNGLPMTPSEYEAIVRRCTMRTKTRAAIKRRK
jgi:hypothetical protein